MSKLKMVTMRDGTVAAEALILTTMGILDSFIEDREDGASVFLFLELVNKVRDPGYQLSELTLWKLQKKCIAIARDDGSIVEAAAEIIRNAVEGEGLEIRIVNPIAE